MQLESTEARNVAERMYAAGWVPGEIEKYLSTRARTPPSEASINRWCSVPENNDPAVERLQRMRVLRAAGMSYGGIAIMARVDWGAPMSDETARYLLKAKKLTQVCRSHLLGVPRERVGTPVTNHQGEHR